MLPPERRTDLNLAICGPGRAGKDTVSNWLAEHTSLSYCGSTSEAAANVCYQKLKEVYGYESVEEAFNDRHSHRVEWANIIWDYNKPDGITLYVEMLKQSNILNGIRRAGELFALRERGLIDCVIWVDRDVSQDPSLEMPIGVADIVIPNNDTIPDLYRRLEALARLLKR